MITKFFVNGLQSILESVEEDNEYKVKGFFKVVAGPLAKESDDLHLVDPANGDIWSQNHDNHLWEPDHGHTYNEEEVREYTDAPADWEGFGRR